MSDFKQKLTMIVMIFGFAFLIRKDATGQTTLSYSKQKSKYEAYKETASPVYQERGNEETPVLGKLKYGKHSVGFSAMNFEDSTRVMPDGKFRPVQVCVWYPAEESKDKMAYRDYVALSVTEMGQPTASVSEKYAATQSFKEFGISVGTPEKAMEQWLSISMHASFDVRQKTGKFPIVIVAQGNFQSAADQAFLCEYIASHGYIVATSPSPTRITGPIQSNNDIFPTAMDQKTDMDIIFKKIILGFHGDQQNVSVIAHSFGARSALIFIQDHPEVRAFVSLDGGIGNAIGKEWIKFFTDFNPLSIKTPTLHFYQKLDSSFVVPDFELLESMKSSKRTVMLLKTMHHYYFSSVGFVAGTISDFSKSFDPELTFKCQSYAYYTLEFLERHVNNRAIEKLDDFTDRKFQDVTKLQSIK